MKPELWDMFIKIGLAFGAVFAGIVTYFGSKRKKKNIKKSNIVSPILDYPDSFWTVHSSIQEYKAEIHYILDMEESYTKQYFESSNTVGYSVLPIRKGSTIMGYIMSHWCREEKVDSADIEVVDEWMHRTQRLIEVDLASQMQKYRKKA